MRSGFSRNRRTGDGLERSGLDVLRKLDVAVTGLGPARLNAEHDDLSLGGGAQCGTDESQIARGFRDHVVGRKDAHDGVGIDGLQDVGGESDGGRGVALRGFGEDLALRHFRQLAHDFVAQMIVGENPETLGRDQRAQAIDGLLDQGSLAEEAQHLLGVRAAAAGPEARASASGQNQAVMVG